MITFIEYDELVEEPVVETPVVGGITPSPNRGGAAINTNHTLIIQPADK